MTFTTREVVERVAALLNGAGGLAESLERLRAVYGQESPRLEPTNVRVLKAGVEITDKALGAKYPDIRVYCERIRSRATETLRRFSGEMQIVIEARVSQDRLEGITEKLEYYCDAIRDALERRVGCLGPGLYLSSEYEMVIEPVQKGGAHFVQTAKLTCHVIINRS